MDIFENQLLETFLVLNHELGNEVQRVELHVVELHLGHIVVRVAVVSNVLVLEASLRSLWKVRQDEHFNLNVKNALGINGVYVVLVN